MSPRFTCPPHCELYKSECYARNFPLRLHWDRLSRGEFGVPWNQFIKEVNAIPNGQVWRHNQAGDLVPRPDNRNMIDEDALCELVDANYGKLGYTYSHYPILHEEHNQTCVRWATEHGFTINLSANSIEEARQLREINVAPVVAIVHSKTTEDDLEEGFVLCPALTKDKTCSTCGYCAHPLRSFVICFPAHGKGKSETDKRLESLTK